VEQARIDGFVQSTEEYGAGEQRVALPSAPHDSSLFEQRPAGLAPHNIYFGTVKLLLVAQVLSSTDTDTDQLNAGDEYTSDLADKVRTYVGAHHP